MLHPTCFPACWLHFVGSESLDQHASHCSLRKLLKFYMLVIMISQEILLDCEQSNVLLAHYFFCILLGAFLFLSTCIRDLASI